MFPVLIDLGTWHLPIFGDVPVFLPTYGALFASSVVLAWWWFTRRAVGLGMPEERAFNLSFYAVLGGVVGAKLLLVLIDLPTYVARPRLLWGTLQSAGVLYGGVVGGGVAFLYYCRRHRLPAWVLADALAAPLALAQGVGRLGCLCAGCCWGVGVDPAHALAVEFSDPRAADLTGVPLHVPLLAIQPIQAALDVGLAVALAWLWRRRPSPAGVVFWTYVLLYSVLRGLAEWGRGDAGRGLFFGERISTSQVLALFGVVLGGTMLARAAARRRSAAA